MQQPPAPWAPSHPICTMPGPPHALALSPGAGDLLCLQHQSGGLHAELWEWRTPRRLWRRSFFVGPYEFTADGRFLLAEGIDIAGLASASPYTSIVDVETGHEVFFEHYPDLLSAEPRDRSGRRPAGLAPGPPTWTPGGDVLYHPDGQHAFALLTPREGPPALHAWCRRPA